MRAKKTGAWTAGALAAVVVLVLVASRVLAVEAVYPVEHARRTFVEKVWSRVVGAFRGASASAENVRLKREIALLALARIDLEHCEAENARLRRALEYRNRTPETWVAAAVLSQDGGAAAARRTLRVDKGALDGISKGAVVVVPEGLVGRVSSVTPHTAEVALLTESSVKVACEIETPSGIRPRVVLSGGDDDALAIRYLASSAGIPPQARVMTSGLGGVFPRGHLVGYYVDAEKVCPAVVFSSLEDVFIRREK